MSKEADAVIGLYERHAHAFDSLRGKSLVEKPWLDRFVALLLPGAAILDIGCGSGEPLAADLIGRGFALTGMDSSETLIGLCRSRFPNAEWHVADMRHLSLGQRFNGLIVWHSLFHLNMDEQRRMFARFAEHAAADAVLMFTSGPSEGIVTSTFEGEPLFHASLGPNEYRCLLAEYGFQVICHSAEDPQCGGATIWLARKS